MPDIREEKLHLACLNAVHSLCGARCHFVFTFAFRYFDFVFSYFGNDKFQSDGKVSKDSILSHISPTPTATFMPDYNLFHHSQEQLVSGY